MTNLPKQVVTEKDLFVIAKENIERVLEQLSTNTEGLSTHEAKERIKKYGLNTLKQQPKKHVLLEYLRNFKNPLVLILLVVAIVSFVMGEVIDGIIVCVMILLSVTLNFFQEYKANQAAEKLKDKLAITALVLRDGKKEEIHTAQLTVGDIIELNAGDLIPADCRIINAKDFFVNQSSLTGESFPVEKHTTGITGSKNDLAELTNIIFSGTSVITGTAEAVVLKTGSKTEFGKIADQLADNVDENDFTRGINSFSIFILRIIVVFVVFIFLFNAVFKGNVIESFAFAVAIAVGLTPEFLPMIMSVTMGKGSVHMARRGAIVKKLTAIPSFGSMDVLCTDKTGTLTQDKIELVKYLDAEGKDSEFVLFHAFLNSYFQTGINNPLDDAIVSFKHLKVGDYKKVDEIPFDFQRKKSSVVVTNNNETILITKGAPEEIFNSVTLYLEDNKKYEITEKKKEEINKVYKQLSTDGFRVIAVAIKEIHESKHIFSKEDEIKMTFLGFTAFLDPAKKDAKLAIDDLEKMGIEIKVITGDNELVANKICSEVGIKIKGIILGHEIDNLSDQSLQKKVEESTIFARFSPNQKNRVIQALRKNNHVVGYMGDGINDAPSLQSADVGISVSNAVDVAKESADIILTHKSLHELRDGVIEGRKTFGNTMKYIMMGISSNFGNMFSVLGAVLFLPFLPMLPIQILLNNFLYDISQLTIPTDKVDSEYVEKPKRWNMQFIKKFMIIFGPISSLFDFITFGVLYFIFSHHPASFQTGWFMESLATQTLVIHIIRTRKLPFIQSNASIYLTLSTVAVVVIAWLIPFLPIGSYFGLNPLPFNIMLVLSGIVVTYLLAIEIGKRIFYKYLINEVNYTTPIHTYNVTISSN